MTIGEFSRATRLSARALRFYHRAGLLEPASIDPVNGYRIYSAEQIADAMLVRQFRSLEMPVDQVREVLVAPDPAARDELITAHLGRMEAQLAQTQDAVRALRALLAGDRPALSITRRRVPATPVLLIREVIDLADLGPWFEAARAELDQAISSGAASGPMGGLWENELFLDERGVAALYVPTGGCVDDPAPSGRVRAETLPPVELAVADHHGPDAGMGAVYAELGAYVARHGLAADGPVRETYRQRASAGNDDAVTEIGYPIRSG